MLKYYLNRQIDRMERETGYDAGYAKDLVDAAPVAVFLLFMMNQVARRPREISEGAWYAAKLGAAMEADCGPCVQLVVTLATQAGVSEGVLRALLSGDLEAVPEEVRVAFLFASHALRRSLEAEGLRERLAAVYGRRAVARLGFQVALSNLFPTLKGVLGHGRACTRVRVGGEAVVVTRAALGVVGG